MANNINEILNKAMNIDGAIGAALVDYGSGMCLGARGGGPIDMETAAAANTNVVKAKKKARDLLEIPDKIEDILITLDSQYHLIRMMHNNINIFLYIVLNRKSSNLAMARMKMKKLDESLLLS